MATITTEIIYTSGRYKLIQEVEAYSWGSFVSFKVDNNGHIDYKVMVGTEFNEDKELVDSIRYSSNLFSSSISEMKRKMAEMQEVMLFATGANLVMAQARKEIEKDL